jgi:hypothetical protein
VEKHNSTTTDGKLFNYNDWEKLGDVTTTIGIPMVGVGYNIWEESSMDNSR